MRVLRADINDRVKVNGPEETTTATQTTGPFRKQGAPKIVAVHQRRWNTQGWSSIQHASAARSTTEKQKMTENLKGSRVALLMDVRRSQRYHSRRRQFFDRWQFVNSASSALFGTAAIATLISQLDKHWAVLSAAAVTVVSVLDLVVGTARMARLHEDFYRQFVALEKDLINVPEDNFQEADWQRLTSKRLEIEANEPPIKRVLDSLCHNDLCRAMGCSSDQFVRVRWYQRLFAQFVDINQHKISRSA
jgi:hypothetical protein